MTSGSQTVKKTVTIQVVGSGNAAQVSVSKKPVEIVLAGGSSIRKDIALGLGDRMRVTSAAGEDTWKITGNTSRNVQVIVVDVDRFVLTFVGDLRTVFPSVKILALTNDPRRLAQAVRVGANVAVPRSTPPKDIAKLIAQLAKRR